MLVVLVQMVGIVEKGSMEEGSAPPTAEGSPLEHRHLPSAYP